MFICIYARISYKENPIKCFYMVLIIFQAHIDTKSASGMFELLRKKLTMSSAYTHLLSLLQHLLLLPCKYGNCGTILVLDDNLL